MGISEEGLEIWLHGHIQQKYIHTKIHQVIYLRSAYFSISELYL